MDGFLLVSPRLEPYEHLGAIVKKFCSSLLLAAVIAWLTASGNDSVAKSALKSEETAQQKAKVEGERADVEKRLSDLQKKLQAQTQQTEEASAALKKADQAISSANRRLSSLKKERETVENRLEKLREESRSVGSNLSSAQTLVEQIARAQYVNLRQKSWQSFIDGDNPNERSRTAAQLKYLAHAQTRAVSSLAAEQNRIDDVAKETQARRAELRRIAQEEEKSRKVLLEEKRDRQQAVKKLNQEIASQQAAIEKLKKDQTRLGNLVALIDKKLAAERAAEEAAQKRQEAEAARKAASKRAAQKPIPLMKGGNFAKLKGKLTRPVSGRVAAQFGTKRSGSAKWQGLLFRAPEGAEVSACAAGTVVFSDWLRGYGNLIIIDHGNTYMSVYANNETVYKNVGDRVKQGETISTVGNSVGDDEPGLYFEIRYKGKPVNPSPWLRK